MPNEDYPDHDHIYQANQANLRPIKNSPPTLAG
jgi:hypothetical protein